jgi:hypothetical protein
MNTILSDYPLLSIYGLQTFADLCNRFFSRSADLFCLFKHSLLISGTTCKNNDVLRLLTREKGARSNSTDETVLENFDSELKNSTDKLNILSH